MGFHVGSRMLDLVVLRDCAGKRELKVLTIMKFLKSTFWKVTVDDCFCFSLLLCLIVRPAQRLQMWILGKLTVFLREHQLRIFD
jgi:hypothetical protein